MRARCFRRRRRSFPCLAKLWSRGLLATTGLYTLFVFGWAGTCAVSSKALFAPGGRRPRREHEALLALNQGAVHANKSEFAAAEKSLQRALGLWEALTSRHSVPSLYRYNLALTLSNLGWIRLRQSRNDEAEKYYSRAVVLADQLDSDPELDKDAKKPGRGAGGARRPPRR